MSDTPENMTAPAPTFGHCWHTSTRYVNCCDYCCWCGRMCWTSADPTPDFKSVNGHGPHHPLNRVIADKEFYDGVCDVRTRIMNAQSGQAPQRGEL